MYFIALHAYNTMVCEMNMFSSILSILHSCTSPHTSGLLVKAWRRTSSATVEKRRYWHSLAHKYSKSNKNMSYGRAPPDTDNMISLKVDNLTYRTTPEDLRRAFAKYGKKTFALLSAILQTCVNFIPELKLFLHLNLFYSLRWTLAWVISTRSQICAINLILTFWEWIYVLNRVTTLGVKGGKIGFLGGKKECLGKNTSLGENLLRGRLRISRHFLS